MARRTAARRSPLTPVPPLAAPSALPCLQLKVECKPWKIQLPTRTLELEFATVSSSYHVELNPSDVGNNDRWVGHGLGLLAVGTLLGCCRRRRRRRRR